MLRNKITLVFVLAISLVLFSTCIIGLAQETRPRARDLGIDMGIFLPGKYNAITDVAGVEVGQVTLVEGEGKLIPGQGPIRTGVTVILPHGGNLFKEKVPAAAFWLNAFGKTTGLQQINELGNLEVPIALTGTLNVPLVADAIIQWSCMQNPEIGIKTGTVNPIVGEVNDGGLNDIQGRHIKKEHVFAAIEDAKSGPVEEGAVGGGTGSRCMGFKGGIGTSSRVLPEKRGGYTVGVLVQTNFGGVLTVNGVPVGREMGVYSFSNDFPYALPQVKEDDGSVMVVLATDAPLDQRQLYRMAKRIGLGLARTGFYSSNGSGDFFIVFSTAYKIPHNTPITMEIPVVTNDSMSALFLATVESTEEAVINSMLKATTVVGRDDRVSKAIDIDELVKIMKKYNGLNWNKTLLPWGANY